MKFAARQRQILLNYPFRKEKKKRQKRYLQVDVQYTRKSD